MSIYPCCLVFLLSLFAQNEYEETPTKTQNIIEVASYGNEFSTVNFLLISSDLKAMLEEQGPFTFFAPTDKAFDALGDDAMTSLMLPENKGQLKRILLYLVVPGRLSQEELKTKSELKTVEGLSLPVADLKMSAPPQEAENGTIYPLDVVIFPEGSEPKDGSFSPYKAFSPK